MKKLLTTILLFTAIVTTAQVNPFIGLSIDPKMAISGTTNAPEGITTLNLEFKIGVETNDIPLRIGMYYEMHPYIKYQKLTWIAVDYRFEDFPLKRFATYIGVESSVITRKHPDAHYSNPNNFRSRTNSKAFNPGFNLEVQYRLIGTTFLGAGINIFRAEQVLINDGKHIRWDGMFSVYQKF
jgi:hypothetical protein